MLAAEDFDAIFGDIGFEYHRSDGTSVPLKPGGQELLLSFRCRDQW